MKVTGVRVLEIFEVKVSTLTLNISETRSRSRSRSRISNMVFEYYKSRKYERDRSVNGDAAAFQRFDRNPVRLTIEVNTRARYI